MVSWLTVAVLALTCVVYAAFCAAVVRVVFPHARQPHGVSGGGRVGCLLRRDPCRIAYGARYAGRRCGRDVRRLRVSLVVPVVPAARAPLAQPRHGRCRGLSAAPSAGSPTCNAGCRAGSEWGTGLDATCARLARSYDLTRREEDVLRLLMEGRTFAEAADELVVSLNTVKSHVRRIYAKMGVNGKADLLEKVSSAI